MPKPSGNPDKFKTGGGSKVEAGNYAVTAAKFANVVTDFKPNQLYLVLQTAVLDKDGDLVRGADPVEIAISYGQKSHELFTPGIAKSPDDEPTDAGKDADVEGPTVYCSGDEQFNQSSGAAVFIKTLAETGFPKSTLDRLWAPDLVGLKFALKTMTPAEINSRFKTRLSTKPPANAGRDENAPTEITYKVVDKWLNPNYLSGGKDKGKPVDKLAADDTKSDETAEEMTLETLKRVAAMKAGEKNKIKSSSQIVGFFTSEFAKIYKGGQAKKLAECQKLVKDKEFLKSSVEEIGGYFGTNDSGEEDGSIIFPEAA